MNRTLAPVLILAVALSLAACGDQDAPVAADPGGGEAPNPPASAPASPPAAPGPVRTRNIATVMDRDITDDVVELCLGPVAESYPPQCGGPEITNWDWDAAYAKGFSEKQGSVRWGAFAVTGTWDGERFTVTDAITAALYDPMVPEEPTYPEPTRDYTDAELQQISDGLAEELPGYQGSYADTEAGRVLTDVLYDDGSLQDYVDATYGEGVVVVIGALVDAT